MYPLQDKLDEITAQTRALVQPERLLVSERSIADLFATGIEERMLRVEALAPSFALPDVNGKLVRSSDLLAIGPLILVFFRGRWCPYCMTQLESWRELFPALRGKGALIIGISPQTTRQNDFTLAQHELPFALLRDERAEVAAQFGIAYRVEKYFQDYCRSILVNIPVVNGEDSWRLPMPATFVISPDGIVRWSEGHADFRVRPEPRDAVASLVG